MADIRPFAPPEGEQASPAGAGALPIEWAEEIEASLDSLWLIKKTLPQEGLALIYGHPGSGKSFLAIDLAMHVALGWEWNGLKTNEGVVVYVAAEGQRGLKNRIVAFRRHHEIEGPIPLAVIAAPIDLHDPLADRRKLAAAVRTAAERYGKRPALIVVDTISKTLGAGKENTDDLAVYVANCGALAAEFGCCVLPVHHRPKDAESTEPRGHSSLKGGMDTVILVETGKPKRARITKQKDDEERHLIYFNLLPVTLGYDGDGDPVSSCVVEISTDAEVIPTNQALQKIAKLAPNYRIVWNELGKAVEAEGVAPPTDLPEGTLGHFVAKVVDLDAFSDRAISALRTGSDISTDSAGRTFRRAREKLQSLELIGVFDRWAWRNV
jgi:hypothetical protein